MHTRMHADEIMIDPPLVQRLLADQFPEWADLPIRRIASYGTDNAMFRLGDSLVVRMPRIHWAVDSIANEQTWLPHFAGRLPVVIPTVIGRGEPGEDYPWHWTVQTWIEGENPVIGQLADPEGLAEELGRFITSLQGVPLAEGANERRRLPSFDQQVRRDIKALEGRIDTVAVTRIWEEALKLPAWSEPSVWLHGDLAPGNLLLVDARLVAVIDFSGIGIGDPCDDLQMAWNLLPAHARPVLRAAVGADEATWLRARARSLAQALVQLPYYWDTNPPLADNARHVIREIVAEHEAER
jgi:aminoglycoside phosphotransferase (APT) family kinase protein